MNRLSLTGAAFWALLTVPTLVSAQCPSGDVILDSQSDIANFGATYPACTALRGSLEITDTPSTDDPIIDVSPLSALEEVAGILNINRTTDLVAFTFSNMEQVGQDLRIQFNDGLETFSFPDLSHVGGEIEIGINPILGRVQFPNLLSAGALDVEGPKITALAVDSLAEVRGLCIYATGSLRSFKAPSLTTIVGSLELWNNYALVDVGFAELSLVDGSVFIISNEVLPSLTFPVLTGINGYLDILHNSELKAISLPSLAAGVFLNLEDNPALTAFDVPLLASMEGSISVRELEQLPSLSMPSLASVQTYFDIQGCPAMVSLDLSALSLVGKGFFVFNNTNLSECCSLLPWLRKADPAIYTLENNAHGCNSLEEIEEACPDVIFADGFESGDLADWSTVVP